MLLIRHMGERSSLELGNTCFGSGLAAEAPALGSGGTLTMFHSDAHLWFIVTHTYSMMTHNRPWLGFSSKISALPRRIQRAPIYGAFCLRNFI
jgi:hypothetical protein